MYIVLKVINVLQIKLNDALLRCIYACAKLPGAMVQRLKCFPRSQKTGYNFLSGVTPTFETMVK